LQASIGGGTAALGGHWRRAVFLGAEKHLKARFMAQGIPARRRLTLHLDAVKP
jgi:hypothetical protein